MCTNYLPNSSSSRSSSLNVSVDVDFTITFVMVAWPADPSLSMLRPTYRE